MSPIPVTVPVPICGNVLLTFRADTARQKRKRRKMLLLKILSALNIVDNPTPSRTDFHPHKDEVSALLEPTILEPDPDD